MLCNLARQVLLSILKSNVNDMLSCCKVPFTERCVKNSRVSAGDLDAWRRFWGSPESPCIRWLQILNLCSSPFNISAHGTGGRTFQGWLHSPLDLPQLSGKSEKAKNGFVYCLNIKVRKDFTFNVWFHTFYKKVLHTTFFLINLRWLCSIFCNNLYGKRIWKRTNICICITESHCCTPETNTTW